MEADRLLHLLWLWRTGQLRLHAWFFWFRWYHSCKHSLYTRHSTGTNRVAASYGNDKQVSEGVMVVWVWKTGRFESIFIHFCRPEKHWKALPNLHLIHLSPDQYPNCRFLAGSVTFQFYQHPCRLLLHLLCPHIWIVTFQHIQECSKYDQIRVTVKLDQCLYKTG